MSSTVVWYAARAAGITAYLTLTASVVVGVGLAGKRIRALPRFAVEDVHRFLGLLAGVFIAIHVGGLLLDSVVAFSFAEVLVPFSSSYQPLLVALGTVALELLVALALTNVLRSHIPYRAWRTIHYASFAVWGLATVHGALLGTDRAEIWARLLYAAAVAVVAWLTTVRILGAGARLPAFAATAAGAVLVLGLTTVPVKGSSSGESAAPRVVRTIAHSSSSGRVGSVVGPTANETDADEAVENDGGYKENGEGDE